MIQILHQKLYSPIKEREIKLDESCKALKQMMELEDTLRSPGSGTIGIEINTAGPSYDF